MLACQGVLLHTASHCRYSESSKMQQHAAEDPGPLGKRHHRKSQSAMEYLMTYGWSILIIAVVLGALAYLGVFNPLYFAPKANPGTCQVFRPNGAGTSYDINLLGVCNGEIPEYVSSFNGLGNGFIIAAKPNAGLSAMTITFWIYPTNNGYWGNPNNPWQNALSGSGGCWNNYYFYLESGANPPTESWSITNTLGGQYRDFPSIPIIPDRWQQFVGTYDGKNLMVYLNGKPIGNPVTASGLVNYDGLYLSSPNAPPSWGCDELSGDIANIQIYNTSLDQNSIIALYQEGIGGAPIDLQGLVGWWPLDGNANDYSGNGNNGATSGGVAYTNAWAGTYSQP